jgi:aminopeptidase C
MKPNPNLIREKMIKHPDCYLWDKSIWTEEDNFFFRQLLESDDLKIKKRKVKSGLKVMRISDGKIYDSVKLCRDENGFYSDQMIEKLNNGIEFKRL